jgi:hypothetical protein
MKGVELLKNHLKPGHVYRRADMEAWSTSVDRHLQMLVKEGILQKLSGGVYYVPKPSVFGNTPAEENALIGVFLKDRHFVVVSPNDYNTLGVGTTQLYNTRRVYNYKRHGNFKLGNRKFQFVRKPYVPSKVTEEFLLVDLVNNLNRIAEDQPDLIEKIKKKVNQLDTKKLKQLANDFGTISTKKLFTSLLP